LHQNTLNGYLQLIEDEEDERKLRNKSSGQVGAKKDKKEVKKLNKKLSADIFNQDDKPATTTKNKNVKKLDLTKIKFSGSEKPEPSATATKREAMSFNCDMIKDQEPML